MVGDVANGRRVARAIMPAGSAPENVMVEEFDGPPGDLEQLLELSRGRRRAAEAAAEAAETAAAGAAARAAAAIAAAARAAEEAEEAADDAAVAAEEAAAAVAAEHDAVAQAEAARRIRMSTRTAAPQGGFHGGPQGGPHGVPQPQGVPQPRASFTPPHGQHSGAFPVPAPQNDASGGWPRPPMPSHGMPPHLLNGHPQPGHRPDDSEPAEATAVIPVITPDTTAVIAAIPADAPPPDTDLGPMTVPGRAVAGGRAARRRAQEAAAAVAREATRDPETVVFARDDKPVEAVVEHSAPEEQEESLASTVRGRLRLRDIPPVWLVGAGVGLLIVIAAILATAAAKPGSPASAALTPPASTAADVSTGQVNAAEPRRTEADPTSAKAVAYLAALRNADITTSKTGQSETEAAAVLCEQIGQGVDENELVKALPAVLPTVTKKQAPDVVRLAKKHYC